MKPADLQPGYRIALTPASYDRHRTDTLVVASDPEPEYDPVNDRHLIGFDVNVETTPAPSRPSDHVGHGELLCRADGVKRVQGLDASPRRYRIFYQWNADVTVYNRPEGAIQRPST
jgi:hypothetical protein